MQHEFQNYVLAILSKEQNLSGDEETDNGDDDNEDEEEETETEEEAEGGEEGTEKEEEIEEKSEKEKHSKTPEGEKSSNSNSTVETVEVKSFTPIKLLVSESTWFYITSISLNICVGILEMQSCCLGWFW